MITYRAALEIEGEPREAPNAFTSYEEGVRACVAYALEHRGVRVRMFIGVSDNVLYETHHTVFEVVAPRLEDFARSQIRHQYKQEPPI